MMIQWKLAWRYLWGHKTRSLLTTLAIVFGVMVVFGLNTMLPGFIATFRQNMLAAASQVDIAVTSKAGSAFDENIIDKVRGVQGVGFVTGSLRNNMNLPAGELAVNAFTVVGIDVQTARDVHDLKVTEGRFLTAEDQQAMLIYQSLAEQTGLKLGSTINLPASTGSVRYVVAGILASRGLPGVEEVYVPLKSAQSLFKQPGLVNSVEAIFAPGADHAQVQAAVQKAVGDGFKLGALEFGTSLFASLQLGETLINLFGVFAIAMGGFIIFNTFRTIVTERKRDIGMLRAVGASRRTITGMVLIEGLVQGIAGTAMGVLLGFGMASLLLNAMSPIFQSFLRFKPGSPVFSLPILGLSVLMGVGIAVLAGFFPALSASRVTPLEALRPTTADVYQRSAKRGSLAGAILIVLAAIGLFSGIAAFSGLSAILFLVGLVMVAPALVRPIATFFGRILTLIFAREGNLAQGNLSRQPGRAAITASAMMIGLAVVLALAGMISSFSVKFMDYLDKSLGADYLFMPQSLILTGGNVGAGPELIQQIRQTEGVSAVTSLRVGLTEANGKSLQVIGIDPQTYPTASGLVFTAGKENQVYAQLAQGRSMIINGIYSAQNNLKVGDQLSLLTPEGNPVVYVVAGIGMDYMNAKLATAYISQANLEKDFHQTTDLLVMVRQQPGADATSVRSALQIIAKKYPAFSFINAETFKASQKQVFDSVMYFIYLLMFGLAFPSLIALVNTLVINVLERTREIGTLRAVGSTRKQIRRMILAESLLLAAMGTAFGILAGIWLGYALVGTLGGAGFTLTYVFPSAGILVTVAVGLIFGILAAIIPARQAASLEIVEALRYE